MTPLLVIGLGSDLRGDDAAGLLAARLLAERRLPGVRVEESAGDAVALAWILARHARAVVIDAVATGGPAGGVLELLPGDLSARGGPSSHGLGVVEALALARALGGTPDVRVIGIGGRRFEAGAAPSPEVVAAAALIARRLEEEVTCA